MRVYHRINYLPAREHRPSEPWWTSFFMTLAIKNGNLNQNQNCLLVYKNGTSLRIDHTNCGICRRMFGDFIKEIADNHLAGTACLVPIPSKDALVNTEGPSRSLKMIRDAVAGKQGLTVLDAVRFVEPIKKASEGGPRDAQLLYEKMKVIAKPENPRVVIVDDLLTSEGHAKAAVRALTEAGFKVACGITWGHTVQGTTGIGAYDRGHTDVDDQWYRKKPPHEF